MLFFAKHCYLRMAPPILLTIVFGSALNWGLDTVSWPCFLAKGIMVSVAYLVLLYLTGLEDRKETLRAILKFLKER